MSWRVAESLLTLRDQYNAAHPRRNKASDGTIGDADHQNRNSDHNPWVGPGVVTALDLTHDPANGADMNALANALVDSGDPRIKYIIWNRRIWNPSIAPYWRPYNGSNPHTKHLHLSVKSAKRYYDSDRPWVAVGGATITRNEEDEDMLRPGDEGDEVAYAQEQVNRILSGHHEDGPLVIDGDYGPKTEEGVKDAQRKLGWEPTGEVHPAFLTRTAHVVTYRDIMRVGDARYSRKE